jgi:ribonuclease Z
MRPSLLPRLVNGPFDDPGLFIPFRYEKRAVMFDLGDIHNLSPRDVLKISHIFVTHTHMDHFIGFDQVLRLFLGRDKELTLYGPSGFIENIQGKLSAYAWNLVANYENRLILHAVEINGNHIIRQQYRIQDRFMPIREPIQSTFDPVLLKEPSLTVSCVVLDHIIDCLGFSIEERFHVNIRKDRLGALGLAIGPWIRRFKAALFDRVDPRTRFSIPLESDGSKKKSFLLGELTEQIAHITDGQKVVYIADVLYNPENRDKLVSLARGADHLFIEAAFLEKHRNIASQKYHLTATQAGTIARLAGVKQFTLFHFSPRYSDSSDLLMEEAQRAFYDDSAGQARIENLS